jgi:hypothetical protein
VGVLATDRDAAPAALAFEQSDRRDYGAVHKEFMDIMEEEETRFRLRDCGEGATASISSYLRVGWARGTFWCTVALRSPTGLCRVFYDHVQPTFAKGLEKNEHFYHILMYYWTEKTWELIEAKESDKAEYDKRLREAFADGNLDGGATTA